MLVYDERTRVVQAVNRELAALTGAAQEELLGREAALSTLDYGAIKPLPRRDAVERFLHRNG